MNPTQFTLFCGELACHSMCGVLLRMLLSFFLAGTSTTLSNKEGGPIGSDFIANVLGQITFRLVSGTHLKNTKPRLHDCILIGFCGSLTTFSSWQLQTNLLFIENKITDGLLSIFCGLSTFCISHTFGRHLATHCLSPPPSSPTPDPTRDPVHHRPNNANSTSYWDASTDSYLQSFLGIALWTTFLALTCSVRPSRDWTFPPTLAPFGAGLRWVITRNNVNWSRFKPWTLLVNLSGVALAGALNLLDALNITPIQRSAIHALIVGFCGALTTNSTFISELHSMLIPYAYVYCFTSIACSQAILFILDSIPPTLKR